MDHKQYLKIFIQYIINKILTIIMKKIIIILLVFIIILYTCYIEHMSSDIISKNNKALCLITLRPNILWCEFLNKFNIYDIYIIIDDNNFDYNELQTLYSNIKFIKISDNECLKHGFIDSSFTINKLISGWDKGLLYFSTININYDYVWFMEDDVYFYDENTLINLDNKYPKYDLLSNNIDENSNGDKHYWHWYRINISDYTPPYYNGMMCCIRVSKLLLESIKIYANKHNTIFFLEAFIPTIAIKNNLLLYHPEELNEIHYRYQFEKDNITPFKIYHPVKNIDDHYIFRN